MYLTLLQVCAQVYTNGYLQINFRAEHISMNKATG